MHFLLFLLGSLWLGEDEKDRSTYFLSQILPNIIPNNFLEGDGGCRGRNKIYPNRLVYFPHQIPIGDLVNILQLSLTVIKQHVFILNIFLYLEWGQQPVRDSISYFYLYDCGSA